MKKIPFGTRVPNNDESALLTKLGFDLSKMKQQGRYYFLEIPNDPRIQCKKEQQDFDRNGIEVSFNGVNVINITQKTAIYDSCVIFTISKKAVEEALSKPDTLPEKAPELTEFQKKLANRLAQVEFVVFGEGAARGFGRMLGAQFQYLRDLRKENPQEHDSLIASNETYKKLYEMFPSWANNRQLEQEYEGMDRGVIASIASFGF